MKNILLINQSHTTNVGDKAIGIALEKWLSSQGWNPISLPFWEEKDVFGPLSYTKVSAALKSLSVTSDLFVGNWVRKKLKDSLNNVHIDCAILGGGELFSAHRGFNAAFSCWVNEFVKRGIPCCVIGVSGNDALSRVQINRNKKALKKCLFVGVRDLYSKEIFEQIYDIDAMNVPDAVFLLGGEMSEFRRQQKRGIICVPVQGYKGIIGESPESELDYYHNIVESCRESGEDVVFTTTEQRDQIFVNSLCVNINKKFNTDYGFTPYAELDEFCKLLAKTRAVISGRMHAMILGLLCGDSIIPIPIGTKLKKFNEEFANCDDISTVITQTIYGFEEYAKKIADL